MKKMKRIVSLAVAAALLGTAVMTLSSCGLFAKKVKGTEAAKILLARERLDEDAIGQKTDILGKKESGGFLGLGNLFGAGSVSAGVGVKNLPTYTRFKGVENTGDSIVWSEFGNHSNNVQNYSQFIDPIDRMAEECAQTITYIKNTVGITEKWIDMGIVRYMLIVEENSETVISFFEVGEYHLTVSTRYTTEDAKCVYEIYDYWTTGSENGMVRNMCIPGEHYEYSYRHSSGFNDYFIADKSLGYWNMNRIGINDEHAVFDLAAVKDGLGYGTVLDVEYQEGGKLGLNEGFIGLRADIFDPYENRDLFYISEPYGNGVYEISVYTSNIESGLESIAAYGDAVGNIQGEKDQYYMDEKENGLCVNLSNGRQLTPGYTEDGVTYSHAWLRACSTDDGEMYHGRITFSVETDSQYKAMSAVSDFLNKNGVKLRSDRETIDAAYAHCELLYENFDITEWYGYRLHTKENLFAAEDALLEDLDKYKALYEEVKDYETADWIYDVSGSLKFEPIEITAKGESSYANGVLKVNGLEAKMEASDLLEEGIEYTLQIGLALQDAEGKISGVNEVDLECSNSMGAAYTGGDLVLSAGGDYVIPEALSEGTYVVVAYFATAEDGIRVTEMLPIAVLNATEGELDTDLMDVTVRRSGENLTVSYEIKLSEHVTYDEVKASYTYEEIEKALKRAALSKGYPLSDEAVCTEDGTALNEAETYGGGTYRIKFLVSRDGTMVEAYMYCTFEQG